MKCDKVLNASMPKGVENAGCNLDAGHEGEHVSDVRIRPFDEGGWHTISWTENPLVIRVSKIGRER